MKNRISGFGRSFIAVVVMLTMLFSVVAPTVMAIGIPVTPAESTPEGELNYVSFGDSMSNGYILEGYTTPGYYSYGNCAYPNQFAQWLADNKNVTVNHAQLAVAGTRVEDLLFALNADITNDEVRSFLTSNEDDWNAEKDYFIELFGKGDMYTYNSMINGYWGSGNSANALDYVTEAQEAVKNADVITLAVGNANFGVFLFQAALGAAGFADYAHLADQNYNAQAAIDNCTNPTLKKAFQFVYDQVEANFADFLPVLAEYGLDDTDTVEKMKELILYTAIGYVESYTALLERIVELNEDPENLEIILVANMNTMDGLGAEMNGEALPFGMDDLLGLLIDPANAYMASVATYLQVVDPEKYGKVSFYYAESNDVECVVDTYDDLMSNSATVEETRKRFIKGIVGNSGNGLVWSLASGLLSVGNFKLVTVTYDEIVAYEAKLADPDALKDYIKNSIANADEMSKILSCAVYLGFEKAVLASSSIESLDIGAFVKIFGDLSDLEVELQPVLDAFNDPTIGEAAMNVVYEIIAEIATPDVRSGLEAQFSQVVSAGAFDGVSVAADDVKAIFDGEADAGVSIAEAAVKVLEDASVLAYFGLDRDALIEQIASSLVTEIGGYASDADTLGMLIDIPTILSDAVIGTPVLLGLMHQLARNIIGDGLGAHPSEGGHNGLAESVISAYANQYDAVEKVVDVTLALVNEYYLVALGLAYNYAEEQGYVAAVTAAIEDAKAEIEKLISELDGGVSAVSAIDITTAKDEAIAALEAAVAELEALKADIVSGVLSTVEALVARVEAAVNAVYENVTAAYAYVTESADAALEYAYNKAVETVENAKAEAEAFTEAVYDYIYNNIVEKLGAAYDQFVAVVMAAVEAYIPEEAVEIYDMLMADPAQVVELLKNLTPYVVDLIGIDAAAVIAVVAYAAVNYGDEIVEFVKNNAETLTNIVDTYGVYAWNFIKLYSDATGFTAEVEAAIADIEADINSAIADLEAKAEEIKTAIEEHIAEKELVLRDLHEKLKTAAAEERAKIEAEIVKLEQYIEDLKADLEETLDQICSDIKDAKAQLEAWVEDVVAQLPTLDELKAAIDEFAAALIDGAYDELEKAAAKIAEIADLITKDTLAAIDAIVTELEAVIPEIRGFVEAVEAKAAAIAEKAVEIGEKVETAIAELQAAAAAIKAEIDAVIAEIPAKIDELIMAIEEAYYSVVATIKQAFIDAISADYVITEDSFYVALGDVVIASAPKNYSYAALLAEYFNLDNSYADLSAEGLITPDLLEVIADNSKLIAKADLITVGYSNVAALEFAVEATFGGGADWKALFGEDVAEIAEELIAIVTEKLVSEITTYYQEIPEDLLAEFIGSATSIIEAYVYAYVAHIVELPAVLGAIRETSPDALVVIVGSYNAFDDITISVEGVDIELGKYFDYVTTAINLESFIYALFSENVIYVDAPDVETVIEEEGVITGDSDITDYIALTNSMNLVPSVLGHEYIFEQIINAITLVCDHKYDAKCDADCNICGAVRVPYPHTYYNACDADCNICGAVRVPADHVYTADCDADCNSCGATRDAAVHTFGEWSVVRNSTLNILGERVRQCSACGYKEYELLPIVVGSKTVEDDSNAGVIVAITIPSVLALALGAGAIVWFGVKKKSFADLGVACSNIFAKIKGFFVKG